MDLSSIMLEGGINEASSMFTQIRYISKHTLESRGIELRMGTDTDTGIYNDDNDEDDDKDDGDDKMTTMTMTTMRTIMTMTTMMIMKTMKR